jgi:hypothetical protein
MNKYQKRINKCAKWLHNTFNITWEKSKSIARLSAKQNDSNSE